MAKKRIKHDYVDNKQFFAAMVEYKKSVRDAEADDSERPVVPNYVAECIMKIATHLSYKPNFVNYTFREDMICDGIENCLQYIDNFDPAKSNNPFAYFTQIIYFAFIRRIQKEKKQLYVKYKATENANIFDQTAETHMIHQLNLVNGRKIICLRLLKILNRLNERKEPKKMWDWIGY